MTLPRQPTRSALSLKRASSSRRKHTPRSRPAPKRPRRLSSSTFETAKTVSSDLSLKTISAFRANAEAGFAHLEALVGAKTLSEVVELQTAFLRKRVETSVEQAKEFQAVASKAAEQVSAPIKTVFEKAVKELKVA